MKQYYYTNAQYEQEGPISEDLLISLYKEGKFIPRAKVWCDGMTDWTHLDVVMKELGVECASDNPSEAQSKEPQSGANESSCEKEALSRLMTLPKKVVFGACAAVVLLGVFALSGSSVDSPEDVQELLKEKLDVLETNTFHQNRQVRELCKDFSNNRIEIIHSVTSYDDLAADKAALFILAGFGENEAVRYLIKRQGDSSRFDDACVVAAAMGGHVETAQLLIRQGVRISAAPLASMVCGLGQLKLLQWLISGNYVQLSSSEINGIIADIISTTSEDYAGYVATCSIFGNNLNSKKLMDAHLEIVEYLIEDLGGDPSSHSIQNALRGCTNVPLRKYILKAQRS